MAFRYDDVQSVTREEFATRALTVDRAASDDRFRRATEDELRDVEAALDLQGGLLEGYEWYMDDRACPNCGRSIGMYDFVKTALDKAGHSSSDVVHTLIGNKYVVNSPRPVHCANCGVQALDDGHYASPLYGCSG